MAIRIAVVVLLLISACALPVAVTLILGIMALFFFKNFYELIPVFFINDILFGLPEHRYGSFPFVMTALAVVLVAASVLLRRTLFDRSFSRRY